MFLICDLPIENVSLDNGAETFFDLLRRLETTGYFEPRWWGLDAELWDDTTKYLAALKEDTDTSERVPNTYSAVALNGGPQDEDNPFKLDFFWGSAPSHLTTLWLQMQRPHPTYGTEFNMFEDIVETIVRWRRPVHLGWVWSHYRSDLQPIDQQRRGVGWIGWVPFDLNPADVTEAEVCRAMAGGTFLASQRAFWFSNGDQADAQAIARAQALDHRLNSLGVLPTLTELKAGSWPPA